MIELSMDFSFSINHAYESLMLEREDIQASNIICFRARLEYYIAWYFKHLQFSKYVIAPQITLGGYD